MTAITSVKRESCFSHTLIFPVNGRIPVAREWAIGFVQPAAHVPSLCLTQTLWNDGEVTGFLRGNGSVGHIKEQIDTPVGKGV